jgi:hypothetical protein
MPNSPIAAFFANDPLRDLGCGGCVVWGRKGMNDSYAGVPYRHSLQLGCAATGCACARIVGIEVSGYDFGLQRRCVSSDGYDAYRNVIDMEHDG